ncbi:MAG: hypothetical protein Ctma_1527 [Catillopecten margaritatus gill symbiont]|uniref:Putative mRNA interferase YoeB n=1 Tax=Catillopecten margaritatus gill symbiont TaxID=3083288 RepID=A0AAU6PI87_9GAMM
MEQVTDRLLRKWMKSLVLEGNAWFSYEKLRENDKRVHKALVKILKDILRNDPREGIGKPEPLKYNLNGYWSRRISQKDRVVYRFDENSVYVIAIGGHYDQVNLKLH